MAIELIAQTRAQFGRAVKAVRTSGLIPAELYGRGLANVHLAVSLKDFSKVFRKAGESTIIELSVEGKKHPVLIHDVSFQPLTDEIVHVDFYQVRLDEKLRLKVPVVFTGEAPGVKEKGGVLVKSLAEIEVEALPADLPKEFVVDLTKLNDVGVSISVGQLVVPDAIRILTDASFVIATVTARMTEEQEAALAAVADVSAIKTEGEEKKEKAAEAAPAEEGAEAPEKK